MAAKQKKLFIADKPEHWAALTSPVRNQIIQLLINLGPMSVRDIAEQLGRKPASLYRHIDQLLSTGMIVEDGLKPTKRRDAVIYAFPWQTVRTRYDSNKKRDRDAIERYTRIILRHTQREMCAGIQDPDSIRRFTDDQNYALMHGIGWVDRKQLKKLYGLMQEMERIIESSPRRPDSELIALTLAYRPARRTDEG